MGDGAGVVVGGGVVVVGVVVTWVGWASVTRISSAPPLPLAPVPSSEPEPPAAGPATASSAGLVVGSAGAAPAGSAGGSVVAGAVVAVFVSTSAVAGVPSVAGGGGWYVALPAPCAGGGE